MIGEPLRGSIPSAQIPAGVRQRELEDEDTSFSPGFKARCDPLDELGIRFKINILKRKPSLLFLHAQLPVPRRSQSSDFPSS